jgi:TPR repeat protein
MLEIKSISSHAIENTASKAAQLYKKSCELGYIKGCTAYGMHFYADMERDPEKNDLYYFKKACDGGDQIGCTLLKMAPSYKRKNN